MSIPECWLSLDAIDILHSNINKSNMLTEDINRFTEFDYRHHGLPEPPGIPASCCAAHKLGLQSGNVDNYKAAVRRAVKEAK